MTNYFLTTAFGLSKNNFSFSPYCSSDIRLCALHFPSRGNVLLQRNLKHMSPIHFTHAEYFYFLGLGALERGLVIDAEWKVIALLLQLSKWGGKQPFKEHKMFPRRHFCWQPFHPPKHLYPINPFHHVLLPVFYHSLHKHKHIDRFSTFKKLFPSYNTDSLAALFSFKTQLASKFVKMIS